MFEGSPLCYPESSILQIKMVTRHFKICAFGKAIENKTKLGFPQHLKSSDVIICFNQ